MKKKIKTSKWSWQFVILPAIAWLLPFYHCTGQEWKLLGQNIPVYINHHSAIAAGNGKIYLFGGGATTGDCTNKVYEFNPADSSFTLKAPMPGLRCGAAVAEWDGKIYLFGGYADAFGGTVTNSVLEYDINANTWSTLSNAMPTARAYASAAVLSDGKIYVIGGHLGELAGTNTVAVFDAAGRIWLPPAPSLLKTRAGHVSFEIDNFIFVIGGLSSLLDVGAERSVEEYFAFGGGWLVIDTIPTPRFFLGGCKGIGDKKMYAIGGYNYGVGPALQTVDVFNLESDTHWETTPSMNKARRGVAAASVPIPVPGATGYRIYVFGGNNDAEGVLRTVEYYDVALSPIRDVKSPGHFDPKLWISPNPANGWTTMFYELFASGEVQISLYDNFGRLVSTRVKAHRTVGSYSLEIDTGVLPKGIYIGVLRTESGQTTQVKLVAQ